MRALRATLSAAVGCVVVCCAAEPDAPTQAGRRATGGAGNGSAEEAESPTLPAPTNNENISPPSPSGPPPVIPMSASQVPAPTGGAAAEGQCGAVMQTAQNTLQPVDVIFSIDTSGTMRDEAAFVKDNMNAFSQQIRDAGVDVHVVLIAAEYSGMPDPLGGLLFTDGLCIAAPLGSGMCPADSNPPTYAHVIETIGQWNILDAYILRYQDYQQYLRPSALKTFVSVSDADASTGADKFVADVAALEPNSAMWSNWRYSAIYPFTNCGDGGFGAVHVELVMRTQGVSGDLCQQDFAPVFDALAKKLVDTAQLSCEWPIPMPPSGETFDAAKTNVQLTLQGQAEALLKSPSATECKDRDGWHYDNEADPSHVVACPATCSRIQAADSAEVNVLFGCETQVIPF